MAGRKKTKDADGRRVCPGCGGRVAALTTKDLVDHMRSACPLRSHAGVRAVIDEMADKLEQGGGR